MSDGESEYDIIFRGDLRPGENLVEVKQRLQKLFSANAEKIEQLFSGRPVVLKRGIGKEAAERYRKSLENAGAIVSIRPAATSEDPTPAREAPATSEEEPDSSETGLDVSVAEVGADLLMPEERRDVVTREVSTSHISVAPAGENVLSDEEKKPFTEREIDTSHLSFDDEQGS